MENITTTGRQIYDAAIILMDEQNESTGSTITADTDEYRLRSVAIINVLRHEAYPYSMNYEGGTVCNGITSLDDIVDLDDAVAQGAMPYGLAAKLLLGEDDVRANFFSQKFTETLNSFGRRRVAAFEDIPLHYGCL